MAGRSNRPATTETQRLVQFERAAALGAVIYLPPHSLDLNPIEKCWAKVKQALRAAKARTWDELLGAVRKALLAVSLIVVMTWCKSNWKTI